MLCLLLFTVLLAGLSTTATATPFSAPTGEPIRPLPQTIVYDEAKARLGKQLFSDPLLSLDRSVSCASCHDLSKGGNDPRPVSIGIKGRQGKIASPTVFNAVFNFRQFWNGRAADLREQAAGPLQDPLEMGMTQQELEARLNAHPQYRRQFKQIYGGESVRFADLLDALAEFQQALITPDSLFDRFLRGEVQLSPQQLQGYRTFKELGCVTCHNGINLGGNSYQKIGVITPMQTAREPVDRYALTGDQADRFFFKVPTLRNVMLTAPYFHDGASATIGEALQRVAHHNLGLELSPEEVTRLTSFLGTLTGRRPAILEGDQ